MRKVEALDWKRKVAYDAVKFLAVPWAIWITASIFHMREELSVTRAILFFVAEKAVLPPGLRTPFRMPNED
jgi:hypothetical protein